MAAIFVLNKYTEFVGNPIRFDASGSTGSINYYEWDFDDGAVPIFSTSAVSADYSYQNYGTRLPALTVWEASASNTYTLPVGLTINPHPHISISGAPVLSSSLQFSDSVGAYYTSAVDQIIFDYGDGSPQVSGTPTATFFHQFSATGNYLITLTATDVYDNVSTDTRTISILAGNTCKEEPDYISLCGTNNRRFAPCKSINLTNFLSDYLQETDVYDLVKFFEDFLNEMYSGLCGFQTVETKINASATALTFTTPTQNSSADPRISILEKIKRLTDLHDPDLIDIEYIQFFAKYLGYNVEITRGEIGGFGSFETSATICSASENEKYLRFMVSNLPNWYKIKTTRDMIKVMLYSFGLVGDIIQYYTKPVAQGGYDRDFINWKPDDNDDLATIPDDWFPTPHFSVKVDIDRSLEENPDVYNILNILITTGDKIIRAIESVRPINNVFHNLTAITTEYVDIWVGAHARFSQYIKVESDGYADWWVTTTSSMVKYIIDSYDDFSSEEATLKTVMGNFINSLPPGTNVRFVPTFTRADSGIPNGDVKSIIIDGSNMLAAIYSSSGGVYLSTNDGASWILASTGITTPYVTCLAKNGSTIYAGTYDAGVFISTNGGATWVAHNTGLTTLNIRHLYINSDTIYAATNAGVFSKLEPGDWGDLTVFGGMTDINVQCVIYYDNQLYAGTGSGEVFIFNGVTPWVGYNSGLPLLDVQAFTIWNNLVVVGTHNGVTGGVYYSDGFNWNQLPVVSSSGDTYPSSLFVDADNNLLIGVVAGVFIYNGIEDYYIGFNSRCYSFAEKGTSLYAGYDGDIVILDKSKTVQGVMVRASSILIEAATITAYKDTVLSTDPIPMTLTQQPTFDSTGTVFNYITSS